MRNLLSEFYKDKFVVSDLEEFYDDRSIAVRRYLSHKATKDVLYIYALEKK